MAVHVARKNVKSAPFKHRLEPKKGAKNDQPELLNEANDDRQDCICHMAPNDGIALAHSGGRQVVPGCPTHDPTGLDLDEEEHEIDL